MYLFLITYIQYSSHRGTDFDIYGNYLNYFIYGIKQTLQEQTVGYFFLVSEILKTNINAMKISIDYRDLIYNHGIQTYKLYSFCNWSSWNLQVISFFGNLEILYIYCSKLNLNFFHHLLV